MKKNTNDESKTSDETSVGTFLNFESFSQQEIESMFEQNDTDDRISKEEFESDDPDFVVQTNITTARRLIAHTSWGQHSCGNRLYWLQRRKYSDIGLCTYYTWRRTTGSGRSWNPRWNCEASKYYAPGSAKHNCFNNDNPC